VSGKHYTYVTPIIGHDTDERLARNYRLRSEHASARTYGVLVNDLSVKHAIRSSSDSVAVNIAERECSL